ncbi:MAG: leucyl aminopeptidase [Oceanospirillaceae bacterium]|nr:leucyl aminopeptidase [Oceanospirillaceae bacterium]
MEFEIISSDISTFNTECLVVGIEAKSLLTASAELLDLACEGAIKAVLEDGDITGKTGQCLMLRNLPNIAAKRVLLLGLGEEKKRSDITHKTIIKALFSQLKSNNISDVTIALDDKVNKDGDIYRQLRLSVQQACAGFYQYDETKSTKATPSALKNIRFAVASDQTENAEDGLLDGTAVANGMSIARELGNLPANICTPTYLSKEAQELADGYDSIACEILDEAAMEELGMHSLLSVGHGSIEPSQLIVIKYSGGKPEQKPHVIVGKGVTFDTGGISLKPGSGMDEMKFDMCGAASVMGTMHAIAEMELPINVIGVIAAAENMPSDRATKPGDVITTMSGQTVEVLNTDAEGRLVLCDALTYVERFDPETVIDIATLTGAVIVALGHNTSAVMSNSDALANELISAGDYAADRTWRLPIWDEYQELLDSNFADIANIGGPAAGSITAACFLARFTEKYNWAHLDIAGVAWSKGKEKGATGRAVPILCQYLMNTAADLQSQ